MPLPDWIKSNLSDPRSRRVWFRCWVASWAAMVLMIPQRSLVMLGQAAFFSTMLTFMVPPSYPLFIFLVAYVTIVLGSCLGWVWSCAAMAAANVARDQTVLKQTLLHVRQGLASFTNPEAEYQVAIFRGSFLDVRSSVVFGIFLIAGNYFSAVVQVKAPKLKIAMIFLTIIIDVMCSYGPLFPFPKYNLGNIFMIPIACSVAITLACQLLIFPEILTYVWQLSFVKLLASNQKILALSLSNLERLKSVEADTLSFSPSDFHTLVQQQEHRIVELACHHQQTVKPIYNNMFATLNTLSSQIPFFSLEIAWSRTSNKDLKTVFAKYRSVALRSYTLNAFWKNLSDQLGFCIVRSSDDSHSSGSGIIGESNNDGAPEKAGSVYHDGPKLNRFDQTFPLSRLKEKILASEAEQQVTLVKLLSILERISHSPLTATQASIDTISTYFDANAQWRFATPFETIVQNLYASKQALETERDRFLHKDRIELLQPYVEHFKATHPNVAELLDDHFLKTRQSIEQFRLGARPLYVCIVFLTNLLDVIDAILELQTAVITIADKRGAKKRVWMPTGLRSIFKILASKRGGDQLITTANGTAFPNQDETQDEDHDEFDIREHLDASQQGHDESDSDEARQTTPTQDEECGISTSSKHDKPKVKPQPKSSSSTNTSRSKPKHRHLSDPDALPPTKLYHHVGRSISSIYDFVWSPTGIYALKYCIATFAVWIVAVIPSSAYFSYIHRGLWALIMAQTGLALHGGELVFTLAARLIGTIAGLLYGMVIWYVSAGSGRGNAYELGASTAVFFIPLVFLRVFTPISLLLPIMMFCVTTVLIVGYSWIDSHLFVLANSGTGVGVAWRRALLIIIGMVVAFIVMIFPRPTSSHLVVRKNMAKTTNELNRLWCLIVEMWIDNSEAIDIPNQRKAQQKQELLTKLIRQQFLTANNRITILSQQVSLASLDFEIRGRWPRESYQELVGIHSSLLEALGQLFFSLDAMTGPLDPSVKTMSAHRWGRKTVDATGILNAQFITEVCTMLDLLGKSLRNGDRINHVHFGLLENHFRYSYFHRELKRVLKEKEGDAEDDRDQDQGLSWSTLRDPSYLRYATAHMAILTIASQIDRFRHVVKDLVGEVPLPGFDRLKSKQDDRVARAFS